MEKDSTQLRLGNVPSALWEVIDRVLAGDQSARRELHELRVMAASRRPVPDPLPDAGAVCTRHGRRWQIEAAGQIAVVANSVGMLHLAVLIANTGTEIAAVDLASGLDALSRAHRATGTYQPVLDRTATLTYRRRLAQLPARIDELTADGRHDEALAAGAELEWIRTELRTSTGIFGRPRSFPADRDRARVAVTRAIHRALANITAVNPAIGAHLRDSVHTGFSCWYRPALTLIGSKEPGIERRENL